MLEKRPLIDTFLELVTIDSESRKEGEAAEFVRSFFSKSGVETECDKANQHFDGEVGNVLAFVPGKTPEGATGDQKDDWFHRPMVLCAHLDTVSPGTGVRPRIRDDIITSAGPTILGADDKAGVAVLLSTVRHILENDLPRPPLELVFTVCEEDGILGSRYLDYNRLTARHGLALDATGLGNFVISAPYKTVLDIKVTGHAAHSANPRAGINAIQVASQALSKVRIGQVDDETTCNVGTFESSGPVNVIPDRVNIRMEIRSLSPDKLEAQVEHVNRCFRDAAASHVIQKRDGERRAAVSTSTNRLYDGFRIGESSPLLERLRRCADELDIESRTMDGLGGSDANNFADHGIDMINFGVGIHSAHTTREWTSTYELFKAARLLLRVLTGR